MKFPMTATDKDKERAKEIYRTLSAGQKAAYIIQYYKVVLLCVIIAAAVAICCVFRVMHPGPDILTNVTLVGAVDSALNDVDETVFDRYLDDYGYDPSEEALDVVIMSESSYNDQLLMASLLSGEIDLIAGDEDTRDMLGESGDLLPLGEILSESLLEEFSDTLYIAEDPDTGEEDVFAILLPEGNVLMTDGYYSEPVWLGITYTSENADAALSVMEYLLEH